jgi:AraC-like DNA-binding protein
VLSNSLWQVTGWTDVAPGFNVDVHEASLGCLSTIEETISPHRARRSAQDVERSQERNFHLFISDGPSWGFSHCGREEHMKRGDVVMMAEGEHETMVDNGFHGLIIKCPESWMQTWLPDPGCLVGRSIAQDSRWGRVLSPLVSQLTPAFVANAPLPHAVIADQLGAVLTLVASDGEAQAASELQRRVRAAIRERCVDPMLTAQDVASALAIDNRALHRALAAEHTTFANELLAARVDMALPLLTSRASRRLSMAEVAAHAGFRDERHLARTVRRRTGYTPLQLRRAS